VNVVDVRVCKYLEIDFFYDEKVVEMLGPPISTDCDNCKFQDLFYDFKFWETHESLEKLWRVETDPQRKKYLQALILICASMVKYCKGQIQVSDDLMNKALSLISDLPEELLPFFYFSITLNS